MRRDDSDQCLFEGGDADINVTDYQKPPSSKQVNIVPTVSSPKDHSSLLNLQVH